MEHYLIVFVVFVLLIWIIIGIHEFGHFITAKALGVQVLCFSIGFGKKLFRFWGSSGTEYAISAIPLGGYVKLLDEREGYVSPPDRMRAFNQQSGTKKIMILLMGVIFNLLLGFFAYVWMFNIGFSTVIPIIGKVAPHSLAAQAGLTPNEKITAINGHPVTDWNKIIMNLFRYYGENGLLCIETQPLHDNTHHFLHYLDLKKWKIKELEPDALDSLGILPYSPPLSAIITNLDNATCEAKTHFKLHDQIIAINSKRIQNWFELVSFIRNHPNQTVNFTVKRGNHILTFSVRIKTKLTLGFRKIGHLGLGNTYQWPAEFINNNRYSFWSAFARAYQESIDFIRLNFIIIGKLLVGKISLQSLGGPITIFLTTETAVGIGFSAVLNVLAFISLSIAIINFLPIPGLDGGQTLLTLIEMTRRKAIALRTQILLYHLGLIFVLTLLVVAMTNDIIRLLIRLF